MTAVLPSCIAQAAVAVFGCPGKHACPKERQNWYDEDCKVAHASMKHLLPGTIKHSVKSRAYNALLRRKRRVWQRQAEQSLCELASSNPQAFLETLQEKGVRGQVHLAPSMAGVL